MADDDDKKEKSSGSTVAAIGLAVVALIAAIVAIILVFTIQPSTPDPDWKVNNLTSSGSINGENDTYYVASGSTTTVTISSSDDMTGARFVIGNVTVSNPITISVGSDYTISNGSSSTGVSSVTLPVNNSVAMIWQDSKTLVRIASSGVTSTST